MRQFVVVGSPDMVALIGARPPNFLKKQSESLSVASFNVPDNEASRFCHLLRSYGWEKIFEDCFVPSAEGGRNHEIVRALFEHVGGERYLRIGTPDTNVACYNLLFQMGADIAFGDGLRVLDVGCGPGLITRSDVMAQANAVAGFDFVEANLVSAADRGLEVIGREEISHWPDGSFDLLVSAYTLHYRSIERELFVSLIRLISLGGVWIGNFHKGVGLDWFVTTLERLAPRTAVKTKDSEFGPIVLAQKSRFG